MLYFKQIWIGYLNSHRLLVAKALTQPVWPFSFTFLSAAFSLKSQVTTDFAAMPQKIVRLAVSWDGGSWTRENAGDPSGVMRVFSTTLLGSSPSVACISYEKSRQRIWQEKAGKSKERKRKKPPVCARFSPAALVEARWYCYGYMQVVIFWSKISKFFRTSVMCAALCVQGVLGCQHRAVWY